MALGSGFPSNRCYHVYPTHPLDPTYNLLIKTISKYVGPGPIESIYFLTLAQRIKTYTSITIYIYIEHIQP